jgi:hypothetical protein
MGEQKELAALHETAADELVHLIEDVLHNGPEHAKPQALRYVAAMSNYAVTRAEHDDASRHNVARLM